MTPTGSSLGALDPARLAVLDADGAHVRRRRADEGSAAAPRDVPRAAPRHARSSTCTATHSVAVSVLADVDPADVLPPLTAYYAMRIGTLPLLPYFAPGDARARRGGRRASPAGTTRCCSPITVPWSSGTSLAAAADAIEELEATAKLWLLLRGERVRTLTAEQVAEINRRHPR